MSLADKVEGKVEGYTVDNGSYATLKINGTDYKLTNGANEINGYNWNVGSVNKHDTFYTDGKYVVYSTGSKAGATVDNLAYVTDSRTTTDAWGKNIYKAKVVLADGTTGEYEVAASYQANGTKDNDTQMETLFGTKNSSNAGTAKDKIFTYSLSDGKITLNAIQTESDLQGNNATYLNAANGINYTYKSGVATIDSKDYRTTENTYFFVKNTGDNGKVTVVKASELKDDVTSSVANTYVAQNVGGFRTLLAGYLEVTSVPTAKAMDYYFVTGNANYVGEVDGKHVVELPVNAAGEETKLVFKYDTESSASSKMSTIDGMKGKLVQVALKSDGSVDTNAVGYTTEGMKKVSLNTLSTSFDASKWFKANLTSWDSDGKIATMGDGSTKSEIVKIASDVKVFNVDVTADGNKLVEGDTTVKSDGNATSVAVYFNADKEVSVIFCEVDGADISNIVA